METKFARLRILEMEICRLEQMQTLVLQSIDVLSSKPTNKHTIESYKDFYVHESLAITRIRERREQLLAELWGESKL